MRAQRNTRTYVTALAIVLAACGEDTVAPPMVNEPPPLPNPVALTAVLNLSQVIPDVVTVDCNPIDGASAPTTLLYLVPVTPAMARTCDPTNIHAVTAPDGHHVTLDEWRTATGSITITCLEGGGTQFDSDFSGLVPNGVYTIWQFTAGAGGALASHAPDDIKNVLVADANGTVSASVVGTSGPATLFGTVGTCQLPIPSQTAVAEGVYLVILYHIDDQSWGPGPGPEETGIAHMYVMGR